MTTRAEHRHNLEPSHAKSYDPKAILSGLTAIVLVILTISAVGAYYGDSSGQTKDFFNRNITVGQSLLMVALPITVLGILTAFTLYIHSKKKHQSQLREVKITFYHSLKDTFTNQKGRIKSALIVISFLALIAAVILLANPTCNQWMNQQAIPWVEKTMNHSIKLWEGLAYTGGGALVVAVISNLILHFYEKKQFEQEGKINFEEFIDDFDTLS